MAERSGTYLAMTSLAASTIGLRMTHEGNVKFFKSAIALGELEKDAAKKCLRILKKDPEGNPKLRFSLTGCLPIKMKAPALNAKDGMLAVEEMQIAYGAFKLEGA